MRSQSSSLMISLSNSASKTLPASEKLPRLVGETPSISRTFLRALAWTNPRMEVTMGLKKNSSCRAMY